MKNLNNKSYSPCLTSQDPNILICSSNFLHDRNFSISVLQIPALFQYLTGFCRLMDYGKWGGIWEDEFCAKDSLKQLPGFHDLPPRCLVLKTWSRRVVQAAWLSKIDRGTKSRWCVIKALTYQCICTSPCSSVQIHHISMSKEAIWRNGDGKWIPYPLTN